MGPSSKDAPPVLLTPPQSVKMVQFLALQAEKRQLDADSNRLKAEMDRLKALIVADMGSSCTAVYEDTGGSYTATFYPSYKEAVPKENLLRLKEHHPDIFAEYVSVSESRRFNLKLVERKAA